MRQEGETTYPCSKSRPVVQSEVLHHLDSTVTSQDDGDCADSEEECHHTGHIAATTSNRDRHHALIFAMRSLKWVPFSRNLLSRDAASRLDLKTSGGQSLTRGAHLMASSDSRRPCLVPFPAGLKVYSLRLRRRTLDVYGEGCSDPLETGHAPFLGSSILDTHCLAWIIWGLGTSWVPEGGARFRLAVSAVAIKKGSSIGYVACKNPPDLPTQG